MEIYLGYRRHHANVGPIDAAGGGPAKGLEVFSVILNGITIRF